MKPIRARVMLAAGLIAAAGTLTGTLLAAAPASAAAPSVVVIACGKSMGRDYFSRLTWIFTGKRPGRAPVTQTFTLPAR